MATSRILGPARVEAEKKIAAAVVDGLLAAGYLVEVNDGEGTVVAATKDREVLVGGLHTTDEDLLTAYRLTFTDELKRVGWVQVIYGNSGWDVVCDNSSILDPCLTSAHEIANGIMRENLRDI